MVVLSAGQAQRIDDGNSPAISGRGTSRLNHKGHEGERRKPFRIQPFAYLRALHGSKLGHTTQSKQEQQESAKTEHSTYCVQESPMPQELQGDIRIQVKCAVEQPAIRRQNDNQRKRYDRTDQQRPDEPISSLLPPTMLQFLWQKKQRPKMPA